MVLLLNAFFIDKAIAFSSCRSARERGPNESEESPPPSSSDHMRNVSGGKRAANFANNASSAFLDLGLTNS